ncbi:MAG: arginine--tRNA ligase [Puniceicoccales bacterium]|jgi:arginyl-tRNA synthetase|nr:arginine--tRNA ligase [Puniceicoccales bacterium]
MWFQIDAGIVEEILLVAELCGIQSGKFSPDVRPSDPRFGDFQANGILPYAREHGLNPRQVAEKVAAKLRMNELFANKIDIDVAGPGFINFKLSNSFLSEWINAYKSEDDYRAAVSSKLSGKRIVIDYSSPNTAKQMHVGHLRSMNIGEAIRNILKFCGAEVISDNHIGDWGTQFGILIAAIKASGVNIATLTLDEIENLYQRGNALVQGDGMALAAARNELVKLQSGDGDNAKIWEKIVEISKSSFDEIYRDMGISFDYTLGESFYRDRVDRVYDELEGEKIAVMSDGALCVFHGDHDRFKEQPFIVRKADGASNYATTDLATVLYRTEELRADTLIYVTDGRQQDHFQQLFLTVRKWYAAFGRPCPEMRHVWFGMILGEDGKAIKTRAGTPVKLKELLAEAKSRALAVINERSENLSDSERELVAKVIGIDSVKYIDLLSNRTNDYVFSWEKMLSFDGNTATYLLYAIARMKSILRKSILRKCGSSPDGVSVDCLETEEERNLVRKLTYFPIVLSQAVDDLRPHHICTYLFELTGEYSTFYNANRVIGEAENVASRRLTIILRTLSVLETGMGLLGLETIEKM